MSDELLILHCSPTLADLKVGNIFSCKCSCIIKLQQKLKSYNRLLNSKGIFLTLLSLKKDNALIYMFRTKRLQQYMDSTEIKKFMKSYGYSNGSIYHYIKKLSHKLQTHDEFPHEIGIFLGYPLEDVKCFIKNEGRNCQCIGTWKAYHNLDDALKVFDSYKRCTKVYKDKLQSGTSFEDLVSGL